MKVIKSAGELDLRWAGITAFSGTAGLLAYFAVSATSHGSRLAVPLTFIFAFGICVSSIGLYHILGGAAGSRLALIAAVSEIIASAQLLAMIMVQASVYMIVDQPDPALKAVWWGLDVGWDLYIGAGMILFALCMFGRRGLGAWIGAPGVLIGSLLLILNIATFPAPPDTAGLWDVGPLVGLWHLVVYLRLGFFSFQQVRQQRRSIAAVS